MKHSIENFDKERFNADIAQDLTELLKNWATNIPDFPLNYKTIGEMRVFDELEKALGEFPKSLVSAYGENFYEDILQELFEQYKLSISEKLRLELFDIAGKGNMEKGCSLFIKAYLTNKKLYEILYDQCPIFRQFIDGIAQKYKDEFNRGRKVESGFKIFRAIKSLGLSLLTDPMVDAAFGIKSGGEKTASDPVFKQMIFIFIESKLWQE